MRAPHSRTLADLLDEQAERYPERIAAVHLGRSVTYPELAQRSWRLAAALQRLGVRRGDCVGILMHNCIEWLEACFGASAIGATVVPFSTWSKPAELDFLIRDSETAFVIAVDRFGGQSFTDAFSELVPELPQSCAGGRLGSARYPRLRGIAILGDSVGPGMARYNELIAGAPLAELPAPGTGASAADDAIILYTSGSSSVPKAVRLSHYGIIENGFNIGERQGLGPDDSVLLAPPLFWAYGGANAMPATLTHGATLVLQTKFEPGEALDLIETLRCTAMYTLPGMTSALVRHAAFTPERTRSLRTGLTIGSPQDLLTAATTLGAQEICNIYGASETFGNCAVTSHAWDIQRRAQCQGEPLPGVQIRIVHPETGEVLPPGETGLVEVKGYLMTGYGGISAELNAKVFTADGYFRSGDMGQMTADGCFVFVGRTTEMIKRAGINVSPAEVEEVLLQHEKVAQAGVTGVSDPSRGEVIVAFVVARQGKSVAPEELIAHCRTVASRYKVPDRIVVCEMLPLTVTGKLMRRDLQQQAEALTAAKA